ncbi:gamma-glutamylcyclotransferase family protein [Eisenbergiella tayi]|uniref:gamma-glutamylcyclotransferase family protein n=1 Tax=Eisenbergiella tayi TaxID=1432052 RepID=UPI0009C0BD0C|nr:gamma-glutamylcyclotransferase family protein [Eisenbergiella tayi]
MDKKTKLYIAYGSNLNLPQMAIRCPGAAVVGKSELKDYELLFRGGRHHAVATVEPKEGSSVPVLLWEIDQRDEMALDRYEGYPRLYGKHWMEVEMGDKLASAMVYLMAPGYEYGIPADQYADTIWEGYETAGFPTQILEDAINEAYDRAVRQESNNKQFPFAGSDWEQHR